MLPRVHPTAAAIHAPTPLKLPYSAKSSAVRRLSSDGSCNHLSASSSPARSTSYAGASRTSRFRMHSQAHAKANCCGNTRAITVRVSRRAPALTSSSMSWRALPANVSSRSRVALLRLADSSDDWIDMILPSLVDLCHGALERGDSAGSEIEQRALHFRLASRFDAHLGGGNFHVHRGIDSDLLIRGLRDLSRGFDGDLFTADLDIAVLVQDDLRGTALQCDRIARAQLVRLTHRFGGVLADIFLAIALDVERVILCNPGHTVLVYFQRVVLMNLCRSRFFFIFFQAN